MATKRTSALFLGLALAAMGTSASAGSGGGSGGGGGGYDYDYDWKSLPGATCHAKYGYDAQYFYKDEKDGSISWGGDYYPPGNNNYNEVAYNSGGSGGGGYGGGYDYDYKEVICPILRDGYNRGNYNDWIKAYFWVKSSYGKKLECTLYSASPTKEGGYRSDWAWTTSNAKYKLEFEIHPYSMKYGSYYFHCRVPKGGRLYYYFYKEAGPTDYDG